MARNASRQAPATAPPRIRGNVDRITSEGILFGWCLNETVPTQRPDVMIRANGIDLGRAIASGFRQDLMDAGLGDGQYGFSFTLPMAVLRQQRSSIVTAHHVGTQTPLGEGLTYRNDPVATFDDRLRRLEDDLLTMRARLDASDLGAEAIAPLFETVGQFFARLGQDLRDGTPPAEMHADRSVGAVLDGLAEIRLPIVAMPRYAVLVAGAASLRQSHAALQAIAAARLCGAADVFLLEDPAVTPGFALLPVVVRNLRTVRLDAGAVSGCQDLIAAMPQAIFVVVDAALGIDASWLDSLVAVFDSAPTCGLVGVPLQQLPRADRFAPALACDPAWRLVDPTVLAVRGSALVALGGLDPAYDDVGVACIDLCRRMVDSDWEIRLLDLPGWHHLPAIDTGHSDDGRSDAISRSLALLLQRWPGLAAEADRAARTS